jgi:hypothetical protein
VFPAYWNFFWHEFWDVHIIDKAPNKTTHPKQN